MTSGYKLKPAAEYHGTKASIDKVVLAVEVPAGLIDGALCLVWLKAWPVNSSEFMSSMDFSTWMCFGMSRFFGYFFFLFVFLASWLLASWLLLASVASVAFGCYWLMWLYRFAFLAFVLCELLACVERVAATSLASTMAGP